MYSKELWRSVAGFPNYEVSNMGMVRNSLTGRSKTPTLAASGFLVVNLSVSGRSNVRNVHSLVAETFIGPRPYSHMVHHKDENQENCAASNLEYVPMTQRNSKHSGDREKYLAGKLNYKDAANIRERARS